MLDKRLLVGHKSMELLRDKPNYYGAMEINGYVRENADLETTYTRLIIMECTYFFFFFALVFFFI